MCDYKTVDEKITEIVEKNRLNVIKGYAEIGDVEGVLKEAEALAYGRSYAHYIDNELRKKIDHLYEWGYKLESKIAEIEKQLSEQK